MAATASCAEPVPWSSPELEPVAVIDSIATDTISAAELANAPALSVSEVFRATGDDFTYIRGLDAADGRVFVSDEMNSFVRIYDANGRQVRQFGGKGEGPGELDRIFLLTVTNDSILVIDKRGLNLFDSNGDFLRRVPINLAAVDAGDRVQMRSYPRSISPTTAGLLISEDLNPGALTPQTAPQSRTLRIRRLNADGTAGPVIQSVTSETMYPLGRFGAIRAHFSPEVHVAVASDALVYATAGDGTTFDVYREGRSVRRVRFDVDQRRVTKNDLNSLFEQKKAVWKNMKGNDAWKEQDASQRQIPHYTRVPVVGELLVSDDMILVNRTDLGWAPDEWNPSTEPSRWTALSREHALIGTVELPVGFIPFVLRDGMVVGTVRDEFDVPTVVAYRIGRMGEP